MWIDNHLDCILAANPIAAEYLFRGGMKKDKVRIVPFPIHTRFFKETKNKEEIKEQFRLNENKLTLLFSAVGQGIGKTEEYIKAIYRRDLPVNIIAVCGKNQNLFQSLSFLKNQADTHTNLTVLGYVDYMNVLLSIADLFVSKAGPAAVFESLACGCPIIFTHWVGYNEKGNLDFCIKCEVGWFAPNSEKFLQLFAKIMDQEDLLIRYQMNIENLIATPFIGQLSEGA